MNDLEFLSKSYPELALALVERRRATPEAKPLSISPWIATSMLHKSIRRGELGLALAAAATLLRDEPERLWRRLVCASFEDIGLGDLETVALVSEAASGKRIRSAFGGEWAVVSLIVERLVNARKCRSADDLLMSLQAHPAYENTRVLLANYSTPELMQIVTGPAEFIERSIALCYALGTNRWHPDGLEMRRGDPEFVFDKLFDTGYPHCVLELAKTGFSRVREPLSALMSFVSLGCPASKEQPESDDELTETLMVGPVPNWALDGYTRHGKDALRRFLQKDVSVSRFIHQNVPQNQQLKFLSGLLFRIEGGLMRRRMQWETGMFLRRTMEIEAAGCGVENATEPLELLRQELGLLNRERGHVS